MQEVRCYLHQNSAWHLVKYCKYNKVKCHKEVTIFIPSCSWSGTDLEKKDKKVTMQNSWESKQIKEQVFTNDNRDSGVKKIAQSSKVPNHH